MKVGENEQIAFEKMKPGLTPALILGYPDPNTTYILDTDASDLGVSAVLSFDYGPTIIHSDGCV